VGKHLERKEKGEWKRKWRDGIRKDGVGRGREEREEWKK